MSTIEIARTPVAAPPTFLRRLLAKPVAVLALGYIILVVAATILAGVIAPYTVNSMDLTRVLATPTTGHLLGTDLLGRDVLSRLLYGGQSTLSGAAVAVTVYLVIGVPLGLVTGYFSGKLDQLVTRLAELLYAMPAIIIILMVASVFGGGMIPMMVTLGILGSPGLIRVLRGNTRAIRGELYVRAARASGLTEVQVMRLHVLPRLTGPIIVQGFLFAGMAILTDTGLGFLGFGPQPPDPSWGNMVADASQAIIRQPWLLVPTGGIVATVILAFGLLGDMTRDAAAEAWSAAPSRRVTAPVPAAADASSGVESAAPVFEKSLLSVRGLTVTFPIGGARLPVVQDVSFDVNPGETVGIVGESGCGKSVTARALLGLLPGAGSVTAGRAVFDGRDLLAMSGRELEGVRGGSIGLISQEPIASLDPSFTVGSQVAEVVRAHRHCSRQEAKKRAIELLDLVRLPNAAVLAQRYPHQLSGGMAQRVGIAAALAGEPRLLLADEPTTALDVTVQSEILELLRGLREMQGLAVILITHDWGVLADLCDRAIVMYAGQVVEQGPLGEICAAPRHPYTLGLLRSNPALMPPGGDLPTIDGTVPPPSEWPTGCHFQARCPMVRPECRAAAVPLFRVSASRDSRCLRWTELGASQPFGDLPAVEVTR
jgi:peptide/nickel transport system permease protein